MNLETIMPPLPYQGVEPQKSRMHITFLRFSTQPMLFAVMLLAMGCGSSSTNGKVKEGVIEFALTFPDYDPNGLMAGMLPEKTTLYFNEGHQMADLSAGMGVFRTTMTVNTMDQVLDYHMSVMSKKLVSELHPRDLVLFNKESQAFTILYTDITDTIAGYPCKKAVALYSGINHPEAELWYTDAISMDQPNWYGPYKEIPGVLLRYEMIQYGMRMRLEATSVNPGPVEPGKFEAKPDYDKVAPEVLHHELAEVLSTFQS
jgi:GLPGLI family protein